MFVIIAVSQTWPRPMDCSTWTRYAVRCNSATVSAHSRLNVARGGGALKFNTTSGEEKQNFLDMCQKKCWLIGSSALEFKRWRIGEVEFYCKKYCLDIDWRFADDLLAMKAVHERKIEDFGVNTGYFCFWSSVMYKNELSESINSKEEQKNTKNWYVYKTYEYGKL